MKTFLSTLKTPITNRDLSNVPNDTAVVRAIAQAALEVDPNEAAALAPVRQAAEDAIAAIPGVLSATVILTAEATPSQAPAPQRPSPPPGGRSRPMAKRWWA